MIFSIKKIKEYWNVLSRIRKILTIITVIVSIYSYSQIILSTIIFPEVPISFDITIIRIIFWTLLYLGIVCGFLFIIKVFDKDIMLKVAKSHHIYAQVIAYLFLIFLFKYFYDAIKSLTNLESVFTLTLTTILVYATLSLLSFTYVLVLRNEEDINLVKIDIKNDYYYKSLKKPIKPEIENALLENRQDKLRNYQLEARKSGESFLMATALSSIGFFLIYFAMIFTKITFKPDTIVLEVQEFFISYLSYLYYSLAVFILIYSLINFSRGLYIILKNLQEKFGYRYS